ncbi:MAG: aminoacyl-tRNA hydrolase [Sedimentisphaerales bacterium]|nr:aminoacyl-tRNA hydrolase [Sedimentisphaerales bacterium]
MGDMKIVVGLGNPGDEYINTRHNMGFKVIDSVSKSLNIEVKQRKFGGRFGLGEFSYKKLILLKPWQYMNRSGQVVATASGFYKLSTKDLLVITDDMDLEPGRIRIRAKGSAGGHNGLADIIEKLGTNNFARCRIGIGRSSKDDAVDHVLDKPAKEEEPLLAEAIERARKAVFCWIEYGTEKTMNEFNSYGE